MTILSIKGKRTCNYDFISLGEIMLRLDPGNERIHSTRTFRVWEGGGEYNVAYGLRKCFGMRTAVVTALVNNAIGRLIESFVMQGGVDPSLIKWVPFDGIGRSVRNGLNFTERGYGCRGAIGVYDRGHTAVSQLKKRDIDWGEIFGQHGVRWFHTGGIFASLSKTTPEVIEEAVTAAHKHRTIVSYDLNYRPSLWKSNGGRRKALEVNRRLVKNVDVIFGNKEDFTDRLGINIKKTKNQAYSQKILDIKKICRMATDEFPNLKVIGITLRNSKTASINDWGAICYIDNQLFEAQYRENLEIYDRVGGGDSFSSGVIYGLLNDRDPQACVNYGAAHGALAMTTPGDTSMATLLEVENIIKGDDARIDR